MTVTQTPTDSPAPGARGRGGLVVARELRTKSRQVLDLVFLDECGASSLHHTAQLKLCRRFQSPAPAHPYKSAHRFKMSQVATISNSEVSSAIIGTENANPNAESAVLLKVKDNTEESQICSENLRSESSTPVKEITEEQPAAENQIAGIYFGTFA
jgi:hypothetical protein